MEIPKAYNPADYEDKIYQDWEKQGLFNPDNLKPRAKGHFSVVLPPPNVTGTLHLGHAAMLAIEDLMIRYKRMRGFDTVWIPGTDHAAIATQNVVEKKLFKEEKKTRHDLGREKFLARIEEHVENSKNVIHNQLRKMGSSLDWGRESYTLDEVRSRAVKKVFKQMYDAGLIYRGYRIVNWCPRCHSTLADDEVDHKDEVAKVYTFKYDKNFPFAIATTRPETKLGDTAVAVHPDDERYAPYVGQTFSADFCGIKLNIKVIADAQVEKDFGTGALGVTPAHSLVDYEMAQKNKLPMIKVIDEAGKITVAGGKFVGLGVVQAREKIVTQLRASGLLEKEEDMPHSLSVCYRCKTVVEPLPSDQWFVNVSAKCKVQSAKLRKIVGKGEASLKEVALAVVKKGAIKIIPERFEKVYFHWMENLRDWCISRQIWFGHRIPVFYDLRDKNNAGGRIGFKSQTFFLNKNQRDELTARNLFFGCLGDQIEYIGFNGMAFVIDKQWTDLQELRKSIDTIKTDGCKKYRILINSEEQKDFEIQDPDTLDTWFSSGLWTFTTLLPPNWDGKKLQSKDIKRFNPTTVLETGYDILPFWVARMILMTTYVMGDVPFENVYLHGLIRDKDGDKMSKSKPETAIDPLDAGAKYGFDAVRLSLLIGNTAGNDIRLYDEKIERYRNFVNKLWNILRFILNVETQNFASVLQGKSVKYSLADRWIMSKFNRVKGEINKLLDEYNFSQAGEVLRDFTWNDFADWYLEISKVEKGKDVILRNILAELLKLWHPFVPFVTEAIWCLVEEGESGESSPAGRVRPLADKVQSAKSKVNESIMVQRWPEGEKRLNDERAEEEFEIVKQIIIGIRNVRSQYNIPYSKELEVMAAVDKDAALVAANAEVIKQITKLSDLEVIEVKKASPFTKPAGYVSGGVFAHGNIFVNVADAVDFDKEKERLEKEKANLVSYISGLEKKLNNAEFVKNAPAAVVEGERAKLAEAKDKLKKVEEQRIAVIE